MRVRDALRQAWRVWKAHPAQLFGFLLIEVVLRLMVLTPLLALADPAIAPAALLSVPLFFLIVPPARACAAEVMQTAIRGGGLFAQRLVICGDYWRKVLRGLRQGALLLLWTAPLIAFAVEAAVLWSGQTGGTGTDGLTLLRSVIVSTFGGGDLVRGLVMTASLFALCLLIAVFGLAFHSGRRHELALSGRGFLKGKRAGVLRAWLLGLLTALPFLLAAMLLARDWLRSLIAAIRNASGSFTMLPPRTLILLALAFLVLLVPLIPLKSLITACYVHGQWEGGEESKP